MSKARIVSAMAMMSISGLLAATGCSGDNGDTADAGASCETATDCTGNTVCVATVAAGTPSCAINCTASADDCGGEESCDGVGALSVSVCQPDNDTSEPPKMEEEPRIPCSSDADCDALQPGAICAQWQGERECTIVCSAESDCDMPSAGGFSIDFLTCLPDEADTSRSACVPDEQCFFNPLACVSGPGL